jgi:hypothetical protein
MPATRLRDPLTGRFMSAATAAQDSIAPATSASEAPPAPVKRHKEKQEGKKAKGKTAKGKTVPKAKQKQAKRKSELKGKKRKKKK